MSALHLASEPDDDERLTDLAEPIVLAERRNAALLSTIRNLENVVEDCVLRLHELGDHEHADLAEQNARSGF